MNKKLEKECIKYSSKGGCNICPHSQNSKNSFGDTVYTCKEK